MTPRHTNSDFVKYHRSISAELEATKDRIRHLIGSAHWLSDGEHKEAILRKVIKGRLAESLVVGSGFVCFRDGPSTQIDILITDGSKPVLFTDGDLRIVTPDSVRGIIEVKTKLGRAADYKEALDKLADVAMKIRNANYENQAIGDQTNEVWSGLFIYEYDEIKTRGKEADRENIRSRTNIILRQLSQSANGDPMRAVNCVTAGPDLFFRFWSGKNYQMGGMLTGAGWNSYHFNDNRHKGLSPAYFISNLIMDTCHDLYSQVRYFWFPIQDEYGKERYRLNGIRLGTQDILP